MPRVCKVDRCKKHALYGQEWGEPLVCKSHNENNWYNVVSPRCQYERCGKYATYGPDGDRPIYCATHGKEIDGMDDIVNPRCRHAGCNVIASYGPKESRKRMYCVEHAEGIDGMENVVNPRCLHEGCNVIASFGPKGSRKKMYCVEHAKGIDGIENVVSRKCQHDGCETQPSFGHEPGKPLFCLTHASKEMKDVINRRCVSCGLFQVRRKPHLCSYCSPESSKRQKTREIEILNLLKSTQDFPSFVHDKSVGRPCGDFRPDFLFGNFGTHCVVLEVDEDQHRAYDPECERIRMINILNSQVLPCVFVRYNPDAFHVDGKTIRVDKTKRHRILIETLREYFVYDSETSKVVYLYYDGAETRTEILH